MLPFRNFVNKTNNQGSVVSGSAAGTKPHGGACSLHEPNCNKSCIHHGQNCNNASCDHQQQRQASPKLEAPQWLCYEGIREVVDWIRERTQIVPQIAMMSGKGLGAIAELLEDKVTFPYKDIPHFHVSNQNSPNMMTIGKLGGKRLVIMQGRFQAYEGFHYGVSSMPVRVTRLLGATLFVSLSCVEAINADFAVGDIVIAKDHLNLPGLCGLHPLKGPNDERLGPRYPDMTQVYDKEMRATLKESFEELEQTALMREVTVAMMSGPAFLTPAEAHFLKLIGADVAAMTAVHENVVAVHSGMKVVSISLVARKASLTTDFVGDEKPDEQTKGLAKERVKVLTQILQDFVARLNIVGREFR